MKLFNNNNKKEKWGNLQAKICYHESGKLEIHMRHVMTVCLSVVSPRKRWCYRISLHVSVETIV